MQEKIEKGEVDVVEEEEVVDITTRVSSSMFSFLIMF